jgi:hypothetical protein
MHTDALHHSLGLIDGLAPLVPRIQPHDPRLAAALRTAATALPLHIAATRPARAHITAARVLVLLEVAQAWGYVPAADLAGAQGSARAVYLLTGP